jgi:hypothetical protein
MKLYSLLIFIFLFTSCSTLEKTEGRKIASVNEYIDLNVDGKTHKLFYKGIDVYDQPRNDTAFIIFNPHLSISKRDVMVTEKSTAIKLCNTFTSLIPGLKKYNQKIVAVNGDLKDFGYFKDNTIGLVSGLKKDNFHIQTKKVQNNFFQEIHCSLK